MLGTGSEGIGRLHRDVVVMGGIGAAFSDSCVREPSGVGVEDGILWEVALAALPGYYI